jgi:hypothetical protein
LIRLQGYSAEPTDRCDIFVYRNLSRRIPARERLFARCFGLAETLVRAFHIVEGLLPIHAPVGARFSSHLLTETPPEGGTLQEANMGEVVRFVSKAERERLRLIREARAMYDSVFPSSQSINARRDKTTIAQTVNGPDVRHGDNSLP